jgi:ubiquinone/menaquinone biosynthesis C-methylase UbiE
MEKLGRELDSKDHWEGIATDYVRALDDRYHQHRLAVIRALIPDELFAPGRQIFDFGCGDAVLFSSLLDAGAHIEGVDFSESMIEQARRRLRDGHRDINLARVGGVDALHAVPAASLDAVLSFNVLAYLTQDEEKTFYQQSARILKTGGYLLVTHSNELFDMFSLNRYTLEFFQRHLASEPSYRSALKELLCKADVPEKAATYNVRENPLTYRYKLARYGFKETGQEFINLHRAPPLVLESTLIRGVDSRRNSAKGHLFNQKEYPDTLRWPDEHRWKLMFVCSTFGSRAIKEA